MSTFERNFTLPMMSGRKGEGGLRTQGSTKAGTSDYPLVTVVTVVFNGEDFLEQTIQSILAQNYPSLEFLVIDGGSTDRSLEIIRKYEDRIDYWVSEKDRGISDAFNKGVRLAAGDYINFQGDGDGFVGPNALKGLMGEVQSAGDAVLVCGRVNRIDLKGNILYTSRDSNFKKSSLLFRMSLPHQGLFTHRKFFERYGLFDVNNKFCMDYEHLLRAYRNFPKVHTSSKIVANWRADGLGNGKTDQILKEYDRIKRHNRVAAPILLSALYLWSVMKFRMKQLLGAE